jgi:hypothetical protein
MVPTGGRPEANATGPAGLPSRNPLTIAELTERTAMSAGELQLRIADRRDRGVVSLD